MPNRPSTSLMLFLLTAGAAVQAFAGGQSEPTADAAACDQLADMPNAPMSVGSCRSMMGMAEAAQGAQHPGDEAMSCDQIFAELRTMEGTGVSDANVAQTDALTQEGRALSARHAAEIVRIKTPPPLAIVASLLPNAVGAALMAPEQARQVAAAMKLKSADARYSAKLGEQMDAEIADVTALMDANPRLPMLAQMAMEKDCKPPAEFQHE